MGRYSTEQKKKIAINLLLALGALAVCIIVAVISIAPQTYDIVQGEISLQTITAPADVVDEVSTQRMIEEEQAKVGPSYKTDTESSQQIIKKVTEDFTAFENARADAEELYTNDQLAQQQVVQKKIEEAIQASAQASQASAQASSTTMVKETAAPRIVPTAYAMQPFDAQTTDWQTVLTEDDVAAMQDMLPEYLQSSDLFTIISMTQSTITDLKNAVSKLIQQQLYTGISNSTVDGLKTEIASKVMRQLELLPEQATLLQELVTNDVHPNLVFDEEATREEKERIAALVTPIEYKQGQNIVRKGEIVTTEQYALLKGLGMLASESTSSLPYYAVVIYIVMLFFMYGVFLEIFNKKLLIDTKKIAILSILTAIAYVVTAIAQLIAVHLFPVFLFVILGAVLLSPKNALVYGVFLSLLLMSVTTNGQDLLSRDSLILLLMMLVGSFFAVYALKDMRYRSRLILAGLAAAIPGVIIELISWMLKVVNTQQMLVGMAIMAGGGLLCGIASIGALPIIENAFKLTTPTKLLELSAPNHPLMNRLMMEATGTYHHSMLVANLAEAACNAVGGYALLARVGAYFHDIGKVDNPMYFKENQHNNINPHDNLPPEQSSAIIRKHVPDGIEMLKKFNMPKEIITIAAEHHGNSLTGYFYSQAVNENERVNIEDFRYPGIPPTTKEGAVIMLADIVEAAVRSLDNPAREDIERMVNKLIKERYDDGQLDNAPLNRRDLNMIEDAFINIFDGVYHHRVKYPDIKIHGVGDEDNVI